MLQPVRLAVIALLLVTLLLTALVGYDTSAFIGRPFHGLPLLPNGMLSTRAFVPGAYQDSIAPLHPEDRVVAVNGSEVTSAEQVWQAASAAGDGGTLRFTIERPRSANFQIDVPVRTFTASDFRQVFGLFTGAGAALLIAASVPVLVRPDLTAAWLLFLALWGGTNNFLLLVLDFFFAGRLSPGLRGCGVLMMASLLHLGLLFPQPRWPLTRFPRACPATIYGASAILFLCILAGFWHPGRLLLVSNALELAGLGLGSAVLLANIVLSALRATDARRRQQAWVVLAAPALTAVTVVAFLLTSWNALPLRLHPLLYPAPLLGAVVLFAYAIVKHNVFEFDAVVRRALSFLAVALGGAAVYAVALFVAERWLGTAAAGIVPVAAILLLTPLLAAWRHRIESYVDDTLFPERQLARAAIRDASQEILRLRDPEELAELLASVAIRATTASSVRLLTGSPGHALVSSDPDTPAELRIEPNDPLYDWLRQGRTLNAEARRPPRNAARARDRLRAIGAELAIPFPPSDDRVGALLLGTRSDGRLYTQDDLVLLETLAAQAAGAIDNSRMWQELRRLQRQLAEENVYLREENESADSEGEIIGQSPGMRALRGLIQQVAPTDSSVLVCGETGTGKELVVASLHAASRRAGRPLVKIACAALPETLLESELFGHERGAFTGAVSSKPGRFELAEGGTLFFDDVDTLPLAVQAKLLRAVQERETQRLGSNEVRICDVRVVAATNRDLFGEVRAGRFREDLYYRLNVVPLTLPPLRERGDDILLLAEHFLRSEGPKLGRSIRAIAPETIAQLQAHRWPGNVRELRNVIERALVLGSGEVLRLPAPLEPAPIEMLPTATTIPSGELGSAPLAELLRRHKIRLITEAMTLTGGNQRAAAEILGMHRPSLTRMIHDLDLDLRSDSGSSTSK